MKVYVIVSIDDLGQFIRTCGVYENYKHAELARTNFIREDKDLSDELDCYPYKFAIYEHTLLR